LAFYGKSRAEKIGRAYVSTMPRLTLLAPDIVEAMLAGRKVETTLWSPLPGFGDQSGSDQFDNVAVRSEFASASRQSRRRRNRPDSSI